MSWVDGPQNGYTVFAKAFRAFVQQFPAETAIKGNGKPITVQAY